MVILIAMWIAFMGYTITTSSLLIDERGTTHYLVQRVAWPAVYTAQALSKVFMFPAPRPSVAGSRSSAMLTPLLQST